MTQKVRAQITPLSLHADATDILAELRRMGIPAALWEQTPQQQQQHLLTHVGRFSYLAVAPKSLETTSANSFAASPLNTPYTRNTDPFSQLENWLTAQQSQFDIDECRKAFTDGAPPFLGGCLFLLAHEAVTALERLPSISPHPTQASLTLYEVPQLIIWDRQHNKSYLLTWPQADSISHKELETMLQQIVPTPLLDEPTSTTIHSPAFHLTKDKQQFVDSVRRAKEYICAGDIFQVVLSNRLSYQTPVDPVRFYHTLCSANPSPYQFYLPIGDDVLVGASPEMMLYVQGNSTLEEAQKRTLAMRLVAGTYPRQVGEEVPDLRADPKEHAEHVMLVDHIRNDIGRVAEIASVQVEDFCAIETYRDLHHLVSQVAGRLPKQASAIDALRSCFPIATLTGTPKIRALEIIAELEGEPRGYYGGTIALLGYDGYLEGSVVIRSALISPTSVEIRAGAGIVCDSIPEREFEECLWKAEALRAPLNGARFNGAPITRGRREE